MDNRLCRDRNGLEACDFYNSYYSIILCILFISVLWLCTSGVIATVQVKCNLRVLAIYFQLS